MTKGHIKIGYTKKVANIVAALLILVGAVNLPWLTETVYATPLGSLAGYWKLDETTAGSVAVDSSGNGNNLTPSGSPQPSTNVPPNISFPDSHSLAFNGSNTLDEANPVGINYGTSPRSLSAWIYPTAAPSSGSAVPAAYGQCAYNSVSTNIGMEFGFFLDSSMDLHFWGCGSSYDFDTGHTVPLNQWSNVTVTYDGTTVNVYLNNVNVGSQTRTLVNQGSSTPQMEIGSASLMDGGPDYYTGNIDDVRVYTRALSPSEVSELYSSGNTSATWTGASSSDWQNSANWNINAVPDSYTNIIIPSSSNQPQLTASTGLASLNIDAGASLNTNGYNLTMNDSGSLVNNGTLILQGGETLAGFTNDSSSGTIEYDGSGTYSTLNLGSAYNNLLFDGTGSWSLASNTVVNKNLTLSSGTLSAGSYTLSVGGNWTNNSNFNAGSGTVILDGSNQSISGSTTFYNLSKTVTSSDTLTFAAGSTQTVSNDLILNGTSGNLLSLRSSLNGSQWNIDPQSVFNLNYLNVMDSHNLASSLLNPSNSTDGGNNLNWFIPYKPTSLGPATDVSGSYIASSTPSLSFNLSNSDVNSTVAYQIEIANNSSFTSPVVDYESAQGPQGNLTFTVGQPTGSGTYLSGSSGQTLADGKYYWRVQTLDSSGNASGYVNANSGNTAFSVDTTPPTIPGTPTTNSPTSSSSPTWSWTGSSDSGSGLASTPYTVEWSQNSNFSSGVSSTTSQQNSIVLPVSLTPGVWYVRVKATDAVGNVSAYSAAGEVTIQSSSTAQSKDQDGDYDNDTQQTTQSSSQSSGSSANTNTSNQNTNQNSTTIGSSQMVLLNNYPEYSDGSGKRLDLSANQVVYFKVSNTTHSATVDVVGGDYVTLTLRSTPRTVTIQTGDSDEYDLNGDGKPDIKITLLGTRSGTALLSFAQVNQPSVTINLSSTSKSSSAYIWLIVLLIGVVIGMWIMWRHFRKQKTAL